MPYILHATYENYAKGSKLIFIKRIQVKSMFFLLEKLKDLLLPNNQMHYALSFVLVTPWSIFHTSSQHQILFILH